MEVSRGIVENDLVMCNELGRSVIDCVFCGEKVMLVDTQSDGAQVVSMLAPELNYSWLIYSSSMQS